MLFFLNKENLERVVTAIMVIIHGDFPGAGNWSKNFTTYNLIPFNLHNNTRMSTEEQSKA